METISPLVIDAPLPTSTKTVIANTAVAALTKPEALPTFPRMVAAVDGYMQRIPWWLLVGATAAGVYWLTTRRKSTTITLTGASAADAS